jgi:hypothetical protein
MLEGEGFALTLKSALTEKISISAVATRDSADNFQRLWDFLHKFKPTCVAGYSCTIIPVESRQSP